MNSRLITIIAACGAAILGTFQASAATEKVDSVRLDNGVIINHVTAQRTAGGLTVSMDIDLKKIKLGTDRSAHVIPAIAGPKDTLVLGRLSVYGRNRYFYNLRNKIEMKTSDKDVVWRKKDRPDSVYHFVATVPWQPWMNGSRILVNDQILGCCNKTLEDNWNDMIAFNLPEMPAFMPAFVFLKPKAELVKLRSKSAVAYVDFPVNQTVVYPKYRNNAVELAQIISTIDAVRNDADVRIDTIFLKGFASPESPYAHNTMLAKGRTEAIKAYINRQGVATADHIVATSEPENWEGLRAYVAASSIDNKDAILAIIDDETLEPDPKEALIKTRYPLQYRELLTNCYPALRKVDYKITYIVKQYATAEEIMAIYNSEPEKLSEEEIYTLAYSLPETESEHNAVLKKAAELFPKSAAANLNAANIAMQEGRMRDAGAYLDKAGDSFEAIYARGLYNALLGNTEKAAELFQSISSEMPEAAEAAAQTALINEIKSYYK